MALALSFNARHASLDGSDLVLMKQFVKAHKARRIRHHETSQSIVRKTRKTGKHLLRAIGTDVSWSLLLQIDSLRHAAVE